MVCLCAPGVVAEALESLMKGEAAQPVFAECVRYDPVLAVRLQAFPAQFTPELQALLRALLLASPMASGAAQATYATRWRQSIRVAHLAQALGTRTGAVEADVAWHAGLCHNLGDYLETGIQPPAHAADWLAGADRDGWTADAVRFHAEPLARGRAAHPLVRSVQLAYQLVIRPDAVDSVDVRAALATLCVSPGEAAAMVAESLAQTRQLAVRFGLADSVVPPGGNGFERLARLYATEAAQSALHSHFGLAGETAQVFALLQDGLFALFGIERTCLFVPAATGELRLSPLMYATPGLSTLAIPPDEGHSALSRALSHATPQSFEQRGLETALVDAQIARLMGVSRLTCLPLTLHEGQVGVVVLGDASPDALLSPLWQAMFDECAAALQPAAAALPGQAVAPPMPGSAPCDDIPRDRVRRAVHEVANPLTIMRNYINLLSGRVGTDVTIQRDLGIISDEIERVARIVRGITATEDVVVVDTELELVSVNSIVSELVRMALGTLFMPSKVKVQIDLNPDIPAMPLQKDLLKQVLFNLAKNAVEAMQEGGHLKFSTRLVDADGQRQIEIEVADTGPGLPDKVVSRLFEPVDSEKGAEHAGLGLSISRTLVERMHGQLSCVTTPQGTFFTIRLPTLQNGQTPLTTTRYGSM